jgi:hypothetical protein
MKLYIPKDREAQNILIAGAAGTRKSSILRSLAEQAMSRGWPCIFTDLKCEYVAEFYRPGIDYLVNFTDTRCVRWMLHEEATNPLEAASIAHIIIPEKQNSIPFFIENARNILSFLLGALKLSPSAITRLLTNPKELEDALAGTRYEPLLEGEGDVRNGTLGNLNYATHALSLLPDDDGRQEFTVRQWCEAGKNRQGNIFLASSPKDFKAQKSLQTLMLNLLFLGVQSCKGPAMFILDEVGVYGEIPELEPALSFQRSSGNPIALAFQSFSQLRATYGNDKAESITSNPYSKIILGMSSPREVQYASELIGMPSEIERVNESISAHWWQSANKRRHDYSSQRVMVPMVIPGEIQSSENGRGYLAQAGRITPLQIEFRAHKENQPKFLEREWPVYVPPEKKPKEEKEKAPRKARGAREYPKEKMSA